MGGCIYRTKDGECNIPNRSTEYGPLCRPDCTDKHPSNADRIRAMTDEELAEFLWSIGNNPATGNYYLNGKLLFSCADGNGWLKWLKQEERR